MSRRDELIHALVRPRLLPLAAAIVVVASALGYANHRLSLEHMAASTTPPLASTSDDLTRAMWWAGSMRGRSAPVIVAAGASALREALDDTPTLGPRVRAATQNRFDYVPLFTSGQTMTETLALLTSLRAPIGSVVFVQLTPTRFTETAGAARMETRTPRLPLVDYSRVDSILTRFGIGIAQPPMLWRARWYLSYYAWMRLSPPLQSCALWQPGHPSLVDCAARVVSDPWFGRASALREHGYADVARPESEKALLAREQLLEYGARAADARRFSESVAVDIASLCRTRGWRLLWVRLPTDPAATAIGAGVDASIDAMLPSGAGVDVLDLRSTVVDADAFYDLHHVRPRARALLTDAIFQRIATLTGTSWTTSSQSAPSFAISSTSEAVRRNR